MEIGKAIEVIEVELTEIDAPDVQERSPAVTTPTPEPELVPA